MIDYLYLRLIWIDVTLATDTRISDSYGCHLGQMYRSITDNDNPHKHHRSIGKGLRWWLHERTILQQFGVLHKHVLTWNSDLIEP
uniref:Putative secreted protein n=1 Tax=Anopheles darlingi TaxID=43151 RepID=A0A2M4D2K7_ANODA